MWESAASRKVAMFSVSGEHHQSRRSRSLHGRPGDETSTGMARKTLTFGDEEILVLAQNIRKLFPFP